VEVVVELVVLQEVVVVGVINTTPHEPLLQNHTRLQSAQEVLGVFIILQ
jgi:hypothetical protein